jgi:hypothetical protein
MYRNATPSRVGSCFADRAFNAKIYITEKLDPFRIGRKGILRLKAELPGKIGLGS